MHSSNKVQWNLLRLRSNKSYQRAVGVRNLQREKKTPFTLFWPNTCFKKGKESNLHIEFLLVNFTIKEYKMIKFTKTRSFMCLLFPEGDKSKTLSTQPICSKFWVIYREFRIITCTTVLVHLRRSQGDPGQTRCPVPPACRKKRLIIGGSSRYGGKSRGPVSQQVWHDKDPSLP